MKRFCLLLLVETLFAFYPVLLSQGASMKKVGSFGSNYTDNKLVKIDYDNDGNFIALGYYYKYFGSEIFTSKYDKVSGEKLWSDIYFYDNEKNYRANDFDIDNDNNVYIVGTVDYLATTFFIYNSEGTLIADSISQNDLRTNFYNIRIDNIGNQVILLSIDKKYFLQKKSSENNLIWKKVIEVENPKEVLIDSLNSIYIMSEYSLMKFTDIGNLEWNIVFADESNWQSEFSLEQIELSSDNKIFLLAQGIIYDQDENYKPYLLKYSSSGEKEFANSIEPLAGIDSYFYSFQLSSGIDRIFTYVTENSGSGDLYPRLVVYDYQGVLINDFGEIVSEFVKSDSGSVTLSTLATDDANNIVLGGGFSYAYSCGSYDRYAMDFFLLKLNYEGIPLWKTSYRVESNTQYAYLGKIKNISINQSHNIFAGGILHKDYEGNGGDSDSIYLFKIDENTSGIENINEGEISSYSLSQNYPNPFNPSTMIKYTIPQNTHPSIPSREGKERSDRGVLVTLKVYDILGEEVATLVNKEQPTGNYAVEFVANNLSSGIYFYKLQSGSFVETKKMILLR